MGGIRDRGLRNSYSQTTHLTFFSFQPQILQNSSQNRFRADPPKHKPLEPKAFPTPGPLTVDQWGTGSIPVRPTNTINNLRRSCHDPVRGKTCFRSVSGNWAAALEFFDHTAFSGLPICQRCQPFSSAAGEDQLTSSGLRATLELHWPYAIQ